MQQDSVLSNPLHESSRSARDRIFHVALDLFYESNYENVSIRDIAKAADVKIPTIYNHFGSKDAILKALYSYYDEHSRKAMPDIRELLPLVETEPPHALLRKVKFNYDPAVMQTMDRIFALAARDINFKRSETFIKTHIFDTGINLLRPLLESMIKHGRIEPLDIDLFLCVVTNYAFSASFLSGTAFHVRLETWYEGLDMLYTLIKPTVSEHPERNEAECPTAVNEPHFTSFERIERLEE